jgi:hypothetical protein
MFITYRSATYDESNSLACGAAGCSSTASPRFQLFGSSCSPEISVASDASAAPHSQICRLRIAASFTFSRHFGHEPSVERSKTRRSPLSVQTRTAWSIQQPHKAVAHVSSERGESLAIMCTLTMNSLPLGSHIYPMLSYSRCLRSSISERRTSLKFTYRRRRARCIGDYGSGRAPFCSLL